MTNEFALRIASVMDELKSSHVYFIIQMAYGDITWDEAQKILDNIVKCGCKKCIKIKKETANRIRGKE